MFKHDCKEIETNTIVIINKKGNWYIFHGFNHMDIPIIYCPYCGIKLVRKTIISRNKNKIGDKNN